MIYKKPKNYENEAFRFQVYDKKKVTNICPYNNMNTQTAFDITANAKAVKKAARIVAQLTSEQKNQLLNKMADAIEANSAEIIKENSFSC